MSIPIHFNSRDKQRILQMMWLIRRFPEKSKRISVLLRAGMLGEALVMLKPILKHRCMRPAPRDSGRFAEAYRLVKEEEERDRKQRKIEFIS